MKHYNVGAFGYAIGQSEPPKRVTHSTLRGAKRSAYQRSATANQPFIVFQERLGGGWHKIGYWSPSPTTTPTWHHT
jgi:hypothetical protein